MKKLIPSPLLLLIALLIPFVSCKNYKYISPNKGNATFSLAPVARSSGRVAETATPAFVLVSIKSSDGSSVQENVKIPLFPFGQSYLTENQTFVPGTYKLTQFAVLDAANKVIYASPLEGSDLAKYVKDPLPMEFTVAENTNTQVIPQVLAVSPSDEPSDFGYVNFGFDVVTTSERLNISLKYSDLNTYDSAYVIFKNATSEIKQKLTLDNSARTATGSVDNFYSADWTISISYFNTLVVNDKSIEKNETVDLFIPPSVDILQADENGICFTGIEKKPFTTQYYYYYPLYEVVGKFEGYARLPKDPTNPFVEIYTFNSIWEYAYIDRNFYDLSLDRQNIHYKGGNAFEIYGTLAQTGDRLEKHILDMTSLLPGISEAKDKLWNSADSFILIAGIDDSELILYHQWDLRTSSPGGRMISSSINANSSRAEIEKRKSMHRINLKK